MLFTYLTIIYPCILYYISGGLQQLTCTAKDDMIIHPFPSSPSSSSFTYHGSCEHTLVTSCGLINDFAVSVDFLAANLSLGRVGVRIGMLQKLVVNEDLSVDVQGFGNLTTIADGAKELNDTIIITNSAHATITLTKLGISVMVIYEASNQTKVVVVNMTQYNTSRGEVCGLCGKLSGQLVYSDAVTTVKTGVRESIQMFARSWQVDPGEQILRKQIRECGMHFILCMFTILELVSVWQLSSSLHYLKFHSSF